MIPPRLESAVQDSVFEQTRIDTMESPNMPAFVNGSSEDDLILLKFYFFDVVNAYTRAPRKRYRVVERGPYVYSVQLRRYNLSFVDLEHPKRELYYKTWQQVKHEVGGKYGGRSDSELITSVSMPFQFVQALTGAKLPLFVTKSAHDHLFGYEQALLRNIPIKFPGFVLNYSSVHDMSKQTKFDAQRVDVSQEMCTYQNYQGQSLLKTCPTCLDPLWRTFQANRVQGGDGKFWGKNTNEVFLPQLNRHVKVKRSKATRKHDGIRVRDFTLDTASLFDLKPETEYNDQALNGVFNLTRGYLGVPLFASKPKFLDGDEYFFKGVEGMKRPTREQHDTVFRVHHETKLTVNLALRLQYNILLDHKVYLPLFWFETDEELSAKHRHLFERCDTILSAAAHIATVCTTLGITCIVLAIVITTNRSEEKAKREQRNAAIIAAREEHEQGIQEQPTPNGGFAMILASPSLRNGWLSTPPFVFIINVVIELITLRTDKHIGVWEKYSEHAQGTETIMVQTLLTAFIVGLTVCVDAVQRARTAFIDGEVPQRANKYEPFNHCCGLPWRLSGDACKLGASIGLFSLVAFALPVLCIIFLSVCEPSPHHHDEDNRGEDVCAVDWLVYVLCKGGMAALLAAVLYPFAALRALHQDVY